MRLKESTKIEELAYKLDELMPGNNHRANNLFMYNWEVHNMIENHVKAKFKNGSTHRMGHRCRIHADKLLRSIRDKFMVTYENESEIMQIVSH